MNEHNKWKVKFSILMVILIIIIYGSNYLVLQDAHHIISYVWTHLGFIPVDILIVAFILEGIIEKKEKEAVEELKSFEKNFPKSENLKTLKEKIKIEEESEEK